MHHDPYVDLLSLTAVDLWRRQILLNLCQMMSFRVLLLSHDVTMGKARIQDLRSAWRLA